MTTPTESALLRAIAAHPEEDLPRQVYADLLEENDQPERAEFIRLQVALAGPDSELPRCETCDGRGEIDYFRGPGATNPASKDCPVCGGDGTARKAITDRVSALWHGGVSRQFVNGKNRVALVKPPREYTDRDPVLLIARGFAETLYLPTLADLCERQRRGCEHCGGKGERWVSWSAPLNTGQIGLVGDYISCDECPIDYTGKPTKLAIDIMQAHPTITRVVVGDVDCSGAASFLCDDALNERHSLPKLLFDPLYKLHKHKQRDSCWLYFDTSRDALDALAVTAGQWLRSHTQGESQ